MAYWDSKTNKSSARLDNFGLGSNGGTDAPVPFYEFEPAVVLDSVLDNTHIIFKTNVAPIDTNHWPPNVNGKSPLPVEFDYSWVGRVLVRMLYTQKNVEKEELIWAYPLESGFSEYPVVNEIVSVVKYLDKFFYTRKVNYFNFPNNNVDFNQEVSSGGYLTSDKRVIGNRELMTGSKEAYRPYVGPKSQTRLGGGYGYEGAMGRYFHTNYRIRYLKRREGDLIVESRFGQSIRMGSYDDNRENDKGYNEDFPGYKDYKGPGSGSGYKNIDGKIYESGGGNPMILIRNRQRPVGPKGSNKIYENLPPIENKDEEKDAAGYVVEDVNNDGTSIHITSGTTKSSFVTNCFKKMWGTGEEIPAFQPIGSTSFIFPKLVGDQIVIHSDRVILAARTGETFHYSKKRYAVVTDSEYTVDAQNQIVLTTNNKTIINSPAIYLGEYDKTDEPVLLGQTTVNWLSDLCEWLLVHTHWY